MNKLKFTPLGILSDVISNISNISNISKSGFGDLTLIEEEKKMNDRLASFMIIIYLGFISLAILIITYIVFSVIAINKIFISNSENSKKYRIIAYVSLVMTGGSIGVIFLLMWLMKITY